MSEIIKTNILSLIENIHQRSIERANKVIEEQTSEITKYGYTRDMIYIKAWFTAMNFTGHITKTEILSFIMQHIEGLDPYIDHLMVEQGYKKKLGPHKLATIKRRLIALSLTLDKYQVHNPIHDEDIKMLLIKLTKKHGVSKPAGKAITKNILDDMLATCNLDKLIDLRDYALLLFAWGTGGRRRSEIVNALLQNLVPDIHGGFTYTLPTSKNDKTGKGHVVPLKGKVASAMHMWLEKSGINEGNIFRSVPKGGKIGGKLLGDSIHRIVTKRLKMAGYESYQFCAHSLRSGFVTEAGRRNKPLGDVMAMTTHRNVSTVMKYYQAGAIIHNSAAYMADE